MSKGRRHLASVLDTHLLGNLAHVDLIVIFETESLVWYQISHSPHHTMEDPSPLYIFLIIVEKKQK